MVDDANRDSLAHLNVTVTHLQARIAHLERRKRPRRRLLPLALTALLTALVPLSLLAATPFTDLTGGPHDGNIDAIYNAGITKGCDPPAYVSYCPSANVTREEMASFLARTAGLGGNPPVANAKTAQTAQLATSALTADTATNATDAAQLGGQPASNYLRRDATDFAVLGTFQTTGPLPKSFTITSHGGRLLLFLSGSAYGTSSGSIGVRVSLDGASIALLQVSINEPLSHKTLPSVVAQASPAAGPHTVTFALNSTQPATGTDIYDVFNLAVLELPIP